MYHKKCVVWHKKIDGLVFDGISSFANGKQCFAAKIRKCFHFFCMNGLGSVAFVLKDILNAHPIVSPTMWLGIDQIFETKQREYGNQTINNDCSYLSEWNLQKNISCYTTYRRIERDSESTGQFRKFWLISRASNGLMILLKKSKFA